MTAATGAADAATEELGGDMRSETAEAQAAIVIVGREPGDREILHLELSKRYGADYQILACDRPADLASCMRDLRTAGLPVALVIAGVGGQDPDGIQALSAIRSIDPTALRVAAVRWGDWEAVRSVFDAVTVGTVDHWVTRPAADPAIERSAGRQEPGSFPGVPVPVAALAVGWPGRWLGQDVSLYRVA